MLREGSKEPTGKSGLSSDPTGRAGQGSSGTEPRPRRLHPLALARLHPPDASDSGGVGGFVSQVPAGGGAAVQVRVRGPAPAGGGAPQDATSRGRGGHAPAAAAAGRGAHRMPAMGRRGWLSIDFRAKEA